MKASGVLLFIPVCVAIAQPINPLVIPQVVNNAAWKTVPTSEPTESSTS